MMLTDPHFWAIYAALAIMAFGVYLIVRGLRGTRNADNFQDEVQR